ncbi:MAG TPA: SIMPL domain-containing protein [Candidatus Baltobacteraceae bacterium]|nr:SIMPL domain-containing protein [Candidatus Baltobacteraceae bacterium]
MTRLLALAALFMLFAAPAAAAAPSEITVTAEGRSSTMPDMASANFTISTNASSAAAATSENNARYNRLLEALARLGIAKSDIRTTSFSLNFNPPPRPPDAAQPGQRYGYFVYRGVGVTVRQLSLVGKTVDAAVGAGVTDVNGVSFDTSDTRGQFAQALRDAMAQARTHAQAMASAAGLHIVRVKVMQEGVLSHPIPLLQAEVFKAAPAPVPTQIEPSAVETRATVTVTYEAQ